MEALAAIGLASNVIGFVELGFKLVDTAKEIHQSSVGSTEEDAGYLRMAKTLEASFDKLSEPKDDSNSEQEVAIYSTASECADIARQLCRLLEKTRVQGRASRAKVLKAAVKSSLKRKEKEDLINRLDHALNGLNTQLHLLTRSDLIAHNDNSFEWHSMQRNQLQSINDKLEEDLTKASHNTAVITELLKILEKHRQSLLAVRQHQILESLRFDLMNAREEGIVDAHEATYKWILKPEEPEELPPLLKTSPQLQASRQFQEWLQKRGGIFFIMGKPGAGKSVLMKMISGHENFYHLLTESSEGAQMIVAKFFFWNAGGDSQKSFECLVRGLLHSILSQAPDLIPAVFPKEWKETEQFSGQSWTAHHDSMTISKAFEQLLFSESLYRNRRLVFIIDGLDELEGDHRFMVERIRSWSTAGGENLKICVASREWNVFTCGFSECESFKLQTLTHKDMVRTARDTLAGNNDFIRLNVPDDELKSFAEKLAEKAEGVFLWTSLVLRLIQDGLSDGDEFRHLQSKLDVLPRDMESLFEHMLTSISPENQGYALKMLHFVSGSTAAGCPPLLLRMLFLDHLYDSPPAGDPIHLLASEFRGLSRPEAEEHLQHKLSTLSKRIIGRSKCLLEIRPIVNMEYHRRGMSFEHTPFCGKTVHLAHRKVKEYIEGERAMPLLKKFTDGAQWQAEIHRILTAHLQFLVESGQVFIGWPHKDDLSMRFHHACRVRSHCGARRFGERFVREVASVIGLSDQKTAGPTPAYVLGFLYDILTLVEQDNKQEKSLELKCPTGLFDPSCASLHDHHVNAGYYQVPTLWCEQMCDGRHISLFHLCGYLAIPEFFETLLSNPELQRKDIPDPAGLIRAILFPPPHGTVTRELSTRRAKAFNLVLNSGVRLDQMPYDCWCGGQIELGYRWTVWQVLICKRLLGKGYDVFPEDWNPIVKKLLIMGIDTQFCLVVHHELAKEHLQEFKRDYCPYDDGQTQYVVAEFWTRPVDKVSRACFGRVVDDGPDHGPMAVFLLATDSMLAIAAKEKGGVLPSMDLFEFMGVRLEASQMMGLGVPRIPSLVGWKYRALEEYLTMYKDDIGSSTGNHLTQTGQVFNTTDITWEGDKF